MSPRTRFASASALFFLSGAAALLWEIAWFRRSAHVFGSSQLAMAAVVAAFLAGLGLGAHLFGTRAERVRSPLLVYALCEVGVAVLGFLVPFELQLASRVEAALYPSLAGSPMLLVGARILSAFVVLGPPCVLMGATYPLFVRAYRGEGALSRAAAWWYGANTAGAAAGATFAGFYALPSLGLATTSGIAIALNLAVAAGAFVLSRGSDQRSAVEGGAGEPKRRAEAAAVDGDGTRSQDGPAAAAHHASTRVPRLVLFVAASVGFAALVLQMAFARELGLLVGGTTYAFSAGLAVLLVGMGAGSLAVRMGFLATFEVRTRLALAACALAFATVVGQLFVPDLALAVGALRDLRASAPVNVAVCAGVAAVLQLVPGFVLGLAFPWIVEIAGERASAARAAGSVYAWNTLGTALGALVGPLVLLPAMGRANSIGLALVAFAFAMLLVQRAPTMRTGAIFGVFVAGTFPLVPRHGPLETNLGLYLYGPQIAQRMASAKVLAYDEGTHCDVLVAQVGDDVHLRVNGKVDASTNADDQVAQLGLGAVPMFLAPRAERVCIIGWGSGASASAVLRFPRTRVTCAEIEPAILRFSPFFRAVNDEAWANAHLDLVADDGRSYLQGTRERFDLILTEPSNPWISGVSNLFTREFYLAAREKLAEGGILAQWMQTYAVRGDDYLLVVRTLQSVFQNTLWVRLGSGDTLLVASQRPLFVDAGTIAEAQAVVDGARGFARSLQSAYGTSDVRTLLLERVLLGSEDLRRLANARGNALNTDDNLRLEFDAPRALFRPEARPGEEVDALLVGAVSRGFVQTLARSSGDPRGATEGLKRVRTLLARHGQRARAAEVADLALEGAPDDPSLLADRLVSSAARSTSAFAANARALVALSVVESNRAAVALAGANENARAEVVLALLVEREGTSATLWANLALVRHRLGRAEEARASLERALALDPLNETARDTRRTLEAAGALR